MHCGFKFAAGEQQAVSPRREASAGYGSEQKQKLLVGLIYRWSANDQP